MKAHIVLVLFAIAMFLALVYIHWTYAKKELLSMHSGTIKAIVPALGNSVKYIIEFKSEKKVTTVETVPYARKNTSLEIGDCVDVACYEDALGSYMPVIASDSLRPGVDYAKLGITTVVYVAVVLMEVIFLIALW